VSDASLAEIFKSYDIRGKVGTQLTPEFVKDIGRTFADWLPTDGIVAVGHDMRPDSKKLSEAFMDGLQAQGYDVWDIGLVTSDMIYFAVGKYDLAGGAVITASHNKGDDNGIKLYRDKVVAVGLDAGLAEIRDLVLAKNFKPEAEKPGSRTPKNITDAWIEHSLTFDCHRLRQRHGRRNLAAYFAQAAASSRGNVF
jgi:phosphomannomutase